MQCLNILVCHCGLRLEGCSFPERQILTLSLDDYSVLQNTIADSRTDSRHTRDYQLPNIWSIRSLMTEQAQQSGAKCLTKLAKPLLNTLQIYATSSSTLLSSRSWCCMMARSFRSPSKRRRITHSTSIIQCARSLLSLRSQR